MEFPRKVEMLGTVHRVHEKYSQNIDSKYLLAFIDIELHSHFKDLDVQVNYFIEKMQLRTPSEITFGGFWYLDPTMLKVRQRCPGCSEITYCTQRVSFEDALTITMQCAKGHTFIAESKFDDTCAVFHTKPNYQNLENALLIAVKNFRKHKKKKYLSTALIKYKDVFGQTINCSLEEFLETVDSLKN